MPRRRRRLHIVHGGKNRIFPISISSIFSMKILVASRAVDLYGLAGPGGDGGTTLWRNINVCVEDSQLYHLFFFYICARSCECGK